MIYIRAKNRQIISDKIEIIERWEEHFQLHQKKIQVSQLQKQKDLLMLYRHEKALDHMKRDAIRKSLQ